MTDQSPGSSFGRGFFGCFGMLAAILLIGGLLFGWKVVSDFRKGIRAEDLGPDRITLSDPSAPCGAALVKVSDTYHVAGPLVLHTPPTSHSLRKGEAFRCEADDSAGRRIVVTVTAACDAESSQWCETIDSVNRLDGKAVQPR